MIDFASLINPTQNIDGERLLAPWAWLLKVKHRPLLVTACGDWFLEGPDGTVSFLDTAMGEVAVVAASYDDWKAKLRDQENLGRWFRAALVEALIAKGVRVKPGQCYGYKAPPRTGGALDVSNVEPTDLAVHSVLGNIYEQVSKLPPGAKVRGVDLRWK